VSNKDGLSSGDQRSNFEVIRDTLLQMAMKVLRECRRSVAVRILASAVDHPGPLVRMTGG
jgi:hypothetical protein